MLEKFDLSKKIALITGAGRGIGKACALALSEAGATVALTARSEQEILRLAETISATGRSATAHTADVSDVADIRRVVDEVIELHGRVDVLVNNAGMNVQQDVLDVTEEVWDQVMDTNLKGSFFCAQAVGRQMVEQGSGKIINIASTFATLGFYGRSVYAASKGGVAQLTKVMALEWAPRGVNVNAVSPTATLTRMNEEVLNRPEYRDLVLSRIPAGRWCEPDDVAGAVLFLASGASDMINGHLLLVDGGWSAI